MRRFRDLCFLGLVLGLSGCAGMQQRLASRPRDLEGSESRSLASRGGRLRHQAAESPGRTPREPSATKTAAKAGRPLTNRPPEAVSRYFPGMDRRGAGTAGVSSSGSGPDAARPDPLGVRTSAKQEKGDPPSPNEGLRRSGAEPPSSLPAALNVSVHPDDPSGLYPDALKAVKPSTRQAAGPPDAMPVPGDGPAPATRPVTLPEPVEAPKAGAETAPTPAGSAAVDPPPTGGSIPREPTVVATSASAAPELPGLALDQEPVEPSLGGAEQSTPDPVPVPDPDSAPARGELPQARSIDTDIDVDNDPVLAGRPRLRLVAPSVPNHQDAGSERPPDGAFPASYYAVDSETRPAVAIARVASPAPARPRRNLFMRLFRRSGGPRTDRATDSSARPESRDLAQRRDLVDRVASDRLDESPKR